MEAGTVAFIGTGLMGLPMAARLIDAGLRVMLWNRSGAKLAPLTARGGIAADTPRSAAANASIVCLCLTDATAVGNVLFGPCGIAATPLANRIVIDFSTIGIAPTRDLAGQLAAEAGCAWLDCPVSGGVAGALNGTLVMFAGGHESTFAHALPLLRLLSTRVTLMGNVGAGQATKLCNQLIVATNLLAIAEAIALGDALGVNVARLPEALAGGFADSMPLQLFGPRMAAAADPGPAVSALETMRKDIDVIIDAAAGVGAAVPLLDRVAGLYRILADAGLGKHDLPVLMRLYRDRLNTLLRDA